jgi:sulfite reductase (NADPH) hemoprotein beta-component
MTPERLLNLVPPSVKSILVLEQAYSPAAQLGGPLLLEVLNVFNAAEDRDLPQIVGRVLGKVGTVNAKSAQGALREALAADAPFEGQPIGDIVPVPGHSTELHVPKHESAYNKILGTLFGARLNVVNAIDASRDRADSAIPSSLPVYALGRIVAEQEGRAQLKQAVQSALADPSGSLDADLKHKLSQWVSNPQNASLASSIQSALSSNATRSLEAVSRLASHFQTKSNWIVGSDAWSYDLGTSGVHHALSSGANVNLLIIDSQPYEGPESVTDPERRAKKDIGLYAMNYGNAYVASVAVYGDYSQVVRAFAEADAFDGPAVVVAYLPLGGSDSARALDILKETKNAVDSGFWPLYRWNPAKEAARAPDEHIKAGGRGWNPLDDQDAFQLDSAKIKADMRAFLDRQNHLTMVARTQPVLADSITDSLGKRIKDASEAAALAAYEKLSGAIDGPSLLVLYASDGGNAEKVAKRFTTRARARGLGARLEVMDSYSVEDMALEHNVVLITSTAGQGEFPNNGRAFWKSINAHNCALGPSGGEGKNFDQVHYSVFCMGDSHYWPRPEDAHYYNKPGKDLDAKMVQVGAQQLTEIGLGDDQDSDGYLTGYKDWEARVWKALGVDDVEVVEAEQEPLTNEHIKIASNYLRGTIVEGLRDTSTGALAESDGQLTKFHGASRHSIQAVR